MPSRSSRSSGTTAARAVVAVVVVFLVILLIWAAVAFFRLFTTDRDRGTAVPVPNVVKLPRADAEQMLANKGLIAEVQLNNSDTVPEGVIFQQNPRPDKRVRPGAKVNIWVSMGRSRFIIPQLVGKNVNDAVREILANDLIVGEIKKVYDPSLPMGQVISQQPEAVREFAEAPQVDLLVADKTAADVGLMPNLIGQNIAAVEQLLARSKLHLSEVRYVASEGTAPGSVTQQNIAADSAVKIGQKVELEVAIDAATAQKKDKQVQVQVTVPEGPAQQLVQIKVVDSLGENVVCNETKSPHDTVSRMVETSGDAKILILIRDTKSPWRTDVIPYVTPPPPAFDETGEEPPGPAPPLGGNEPPPPGTTP